MPSFRLLLWLALSALMTSRALAQPEPPPGEQAPEAVVPPRVIGAARVDYPAGGRGEALVVLELVVSPEGAVESAQAIRGEPPFSRAAEQAARSWRFAPARRGDTAVAARIRFEVRFVEPEPAPAPARAGRAGEPARPVEPEPQPEPEAIEVVVIGEKPEPAVTSLSRAEVRQLPGSFGDPFRAVEAMPGVTPIISGVPYFFVRGAPPGNVGYFLDGIRVPLLYHVGLGPSVVHPAIVERVDLYPGGYPARYGRFAGGIVAGETTPPRRELHGEANLRLVDAGALVEGPFADGRGTVLLGGRYSYTGLLFSLLNSEGVLEYWDYQARASYDVSSRDTLSVFSFGAYDFLGEKQGDEVETVLSTEFHRVDLRWDHRPTERTQARLALTLGLDRTAGDEEDFFVRDRSLAVRSELRHRDSREVLIRGGADMSLDHYDVQAPIDEDDPEDAELFRRLFPERSDIATGIWGDVVWQPDPRVTVTPGLRADVYVSNGASRVGVDPRISARYDVSERVALLHAFGIAHQPPSFIIPIPGFQVSGLRGGLQRSAQSSAGVEVKLPADFTASFTLFQNAFFQMTDSVGTGRGEGDSPRRFERRSIGHTVGAEVFIRRPLTKRLGGFVSYTLSRSTRSIGREHFPSAFDRTHVLNLAAAYDLGARWRVGSRFVYYTGFPAEEAGEGQLRSEAPDRIPSFHRIDARIEKRWRLGRRGYWAFVIEVLNATLQKEVVDVSCSPSGPGGAPRCSEEEVGPITIPSIGLEAVF